MIRGLDHVAISLHSIPEGVRRFVEELGLPLRAVEDVPSASTVTAFLPVDGPTTIELVAPLAGQGPVVRSLERRGPGLHHLCFRSDDLDADVVRLRALGWEFTTDAPTPGAHGTRVIFVHPRSTGGVLIELAEYGSSPSAPPGTSP